MTQDRLGVPATVLRGEAQTTNRIGDWASPIGSVDGVVKRNTSCLETRLSPRFAKLCTQSLYWPKTFWPRQFPNRSKITWHFRLKIIRHLLKQEKQFQYRPVQALRFPWIWVSQISRQSAQECGEVSTTLLSPLPARKYSWYSCFLRKLVDTKEIIPPKNSTDTIRNRNHDLPACSAVPQTNSPPRDPDIKWNKYKL